ncbi:MAG: ABC transporter ATP-binding protein [Candidatus Eiseniibacteriota bacterium]
MTLEIINLSFNFPSFELGPVSLNIDDGIMVILGTTGSGKTTLINLIAGILSPNKGKIILNGIDITKIPIESRKVGFVFQDSTLFPHLNVHQNILFGLTRDELHSEERMIMVRKIIEDLGIANLLNRTIDSLSGGESQKVSLAQMLVTRPRIILLDEPLSHLDPPTREKLRLELRTILKKQRLPVIYVTHFEEDVLALADSISILNNGKLVGTGDIKQILNSSPSTTSFFTQVTSGANYISGLVVKSEDGLTSFKVGSHLLNTLGEFLVGTKIGVIVRREDIILSKEKIKTSARNTLFLQVADMVQRSNLVDVYLKTDGVEIVSRITSSAMKDLGITKNDHIYAIFKASAPHLVREES